MKKTHKLTDEQKLEIVRKYKTGEYTCASLGKEYNVYGSSINRILRARSIDINNNQSKLQRKYTINEHYFDIVDTEAKAYFLGFIYADGCHSEDRTTLTINISEIDKHILERFLLELESNRPLIYRKVAGIGITKTNQYCLSFSNPIISKSLKRLGVMSRKTLLLKFPTEDQVPKYLLKHFIRGYWDGDGSFTLRKLNNGKTISLCSSTLGTEDLLKGIKNTLHEFVGINSQIIENLNGYKKETCRLNCNGTQQVYNLIKWMYNHSSIHLERKYQKYKKYEQILKDRKLISQIEYQLGEYFDQ